MIVHQNPNYQISPAVRSPVHYQRIIISPKHQDQMSMASGHNPVIVTSKVSNEYYMTNSNEMVTFDKKPGIMM